MCQLYADICVIYIQTLCVKLHYPISWLYTYYIHLRYFHILNKKKKTASLANCSLPLCPFILFFYFFLAIFHSSCFYSCSAISSTCQSANLASGGSRLALCSLFYRFLVGCVWGWLALLLLLSISAPLLRATYKVLDFISKVSLLSKQTNCTPITRH